MGKLDGKVAVITGATSGMALAGARLLQVWVSELRDRKIRANVLTPGSVATAMMGDVLSPEMKEMFASVIPRREMGRPEEIASVALFLASDDSSYVNGMELVADGGTTVI